MTFNELDYKIARWMNKYGRYFLRLSLASIFVWFGLLKPLGLSPAVDLIAKTVYWMSPEIFIPILGWWEIAIGIGLFFRPLIRVAIFLLFFQMIGTFMPLVILPDVCFTKFPFGLTLEGQYIIKNLILISAAMVIGGTVRKDAARSNSIKL